MFQRPILKNYAKTGHNQQVAILPWLSSDFADVGTSAVGFALGSPWYDEFGNKFMLKFNTAAAALAWGNCTIWATQATDTVKAAPPTITTQSFGLSAGFGLAANAEIRNFVFNYEKSALASATSRLNCMKVIKASGATGAGELITVSFTDDRRSNMQPDADAYDVVPVAGQTVTVIRPYDITVFPTGSAAISKVNGIAQGAVTASHYCFVQTAGLALVSSTGSGTALVMGSPCVPSGVTAGNVIGAAAVAANQVGTCAAASAAAVTNTPVTPIWLEIDPNT